MTVFSEAITSPVNSALVRNNGTSEIELKVTNTGTEPWFQQTTGPFGVDVGYRWIDDKGILLPFEGNRAFFAKPVLGPGESDEVKLTIKGDPKPGHYTLRISMVQEGVAWFFGAGAQPLDLPATVE